VEARDNIRVLNANVLQLFFGKAEANQQTVLDRAVAQEKVRLKYLQDERLDGGGDRLEWNRKTDTYVLTGLPGAFVRMGGLTVTNDRIFVDRPTGKMDFPPGAHPVETKTTVRPGAG
jgi:lipopolysaccharide export system protein LptA